MTNKQQEEFEFVEYQICYTCKKEKTLDMFNRRSDRPKGVQSNCKECAKIKNHEHYLKHKDEVCMNSQHRRERNQNFVLEYVLKNPCRECGETDPLVLEFDHRERESKVFNISDGCVRKYALDRMKEEISKCDVLCANCHNRKTAKESRYFNYRVLHEGYEYTPWVPKSERKH